MVGITVEANQSRPLVASMRSIVATNTLNGTISFTLGSPIIPMAIDSGVSQLWLPVAMCDQLSDALNLRYENSTGLYLISEPARSRLLNLAPEFTFALAANATSNETTSIIIPYAAFDQQIGRPTFSSNVSYFPIRQTANDSLYVLGRAFLQEAYLVVGWERGNFTIGQGRHEVSSDPRIVPIMPFVADVSEPSGLSAGVIAGIAVGSCAAVLSAAVLVYFLWWKRRKLEDGNASKDMPGASSPYIDEKKVDGDTELETKLALLPEAGSTPLHELHEEQLRHQLMSNPVYELPVEREDHELDASPRPGTVQCRRLER